MSRVKYADTVQCMQYLLLLLLLPPSLLPSKDVCLRNDQPIWGLWQSQETEDAFLSDYVITLQTVDISSDLLKQFINKLTFMLNK